MKKITALAVALLIALTVLCGVSVAEGAAENAVYHVTILGTSDIHGNVVGFAYEDDAPTKNNGMARLYTYIQQVRAENPNTVLIDAGDTIQGTIMTDVLSNNNPEGPHPVIAAMNYMGYDAMTLGNHEFNWGVPTMQKILAQANFPVLAQNAFAADGALLTGQGWTIKEVGGVRVAIIGVVTPNIHRWDGGKEGIDELSFTPLADAVEIALAEIGDRADVIVVSAHAGMDASYDQKNHTDAGHTIVDRCGDKVDVLQCAHEHVTVCEANDNCVVGGVRNAGREIARFDIWLDADKNVIDRTVEIVAMDDVEPSDEIVNLPDVAAAHEDTRALVNGDTPLGTTTAKFQPENEIKRIPAGRLMDTAVVQLINKVQLKASGADVSCCALLKDSADLPEGGINYGNIFDVYKYDNILFRVPVTGAELKNYMEFCATYYNQWVPGDINISVKADKPGYLYDMFSGVDYEIDLSQPEGSRIKNVMYKGAPLKDDEQLTLAVNNFRYTATLKAFDLIEGTRDWESSCSIRDLLVDYFAEYSPVEPEVDDNWRIVGVDLSLDDPRRAEIIDLINSGKLEVPAYAAYNLNDYDAIMASVKGE